MSSDPSAGVVDFYDLHPINEQKILEKITAAGVDRSQLSQAQLEPFDQDHYGGVGALEVLAERLGHGK